MSALADDLFNVLRAVIPGDGIKPLHEPEFAGNEWAYVKECIDTGWVSSVGKYVDEFELRLSQLTGAKHVVAVANGTVALQIAYRLAGANVGDEILVPALTFVGTANAVAHCGAVPHFIDSSERTLGVDPKSLRAYLDDIAERSAGAWRNKKTGRRLAALVPMHALGHPVELPELLEIAERYSLPVVEDAAESLGSYFDKRHTGTFGTLGTLSFNGNKVVTTGGGGAILTNDERLARHAKHITTTAKRPHRWEFFHDEVGFNFRLPNLNAALGCAQLERLPDMLARKRRLADSYRRTFAEKSGLTFIDEPSRAVSNFWLNAVRLGTNEYSVRDQVLLRVNDAGYQCRPMWTPMHLLPMYAECPRAPLPIAEALARSVLHLPSGPGLIKSS